jgi:hypothetical protein
VTTLPAAALQQHIAVLGKTGSGKTFAAKAAIVEPLLEAGRRVGIVDPTDAWWGLRSSRDGKGAGFPVLVLGGDHGDLPLPANGGAAVARLLVEQGVNLVASTKHLTVGERTRWFIDFAGTVSRLNRAPLHLVLDEAHNFAPQGKVPDPDTGRMLHAANTLASGGRSIGVRLTMITQRPQKLHKDALTSADTLIAMRVLAPHDRSAVEDWIKGCGDMAQGKEMLNSLAQLKRGEGWVWYPEGGHLKRVTFPHIKTFDSSATPTDGHAVKSPKGAAEIDLAEIRAALAEAVKEAEANDPKLLRAEIARLKSELAKRPVEKMVDHVALRAVQAAATEAANAIGTINAEIAKASTKLATIQLRLYPEDRKSIVSNDITIAQPPRSSWPHRPPMSVFSSSSEAAKKDMPRAEGINGPMQRILDALAWWEAAGVATPSRVQVAVAARYSPKGGAFGNPLGALHTAGLLSYPTPGFVALTDAGRAAANRPAAPATTEELHDRLRGILNGPQIRILDPLLAAYPNDMGRDELAAAAGYEPKGGAFANPLGSLRSLGLIEYPSAGRVVAREGVFLT